MYIHTTEYYLALKRNAFESVSTRWINIVPITQSKISQKKNLKYSILTDIYGIWKDSTDDPICKAAGETQT